MISINLFKFNTISPAKVEYVTPVFAKNFQGSWRYVVQIPYEGYFTQTVEVTRCLQTKCHYLGKSAIIFYLSDLTKKRNK